MSSDDVDDAEAVRLLSPYAASDVADALSALLKADLAAGAAVTPASALGVVPALPLIAGRIPAEAAGKSPAGATSVVGPAFTVEFVSASNEPHKNAPSPSKLHHVDAAPPGSVVVIKSPAAPCAVWGGLMASRAKIRGVAAVVVAGRVRDTAELAAVGIPVFAVGTAAAGAAPLLRVASFGTSVTIGSSGDALASAYPPGLPGVCPDGLLIATGDLIVADVDGIVRVPRARVRAVADLCARLTEIDARCMADIRAGHSVAETFAKHRTPK